MPAYAVRVLAAQPTRGERPELHSSCSEGWPGAGSNRRPSDFSARTDEGQRAYGWKAFDQALTFPDAEAMAAFMRLQVADDVELPRLATARGDGERPRQHSGVHRCGRQHRVELDAYRWFASPVYFSMGSRTHPRWTAMRDRLAGLFPDFTAEEYEGLHHLHTSHQAQPQRVAAALRGLWTRAEQSRRGALSLAPSRAVLSSRTTARPEADAGSREGAARPPRTRAWWP